MTQREELNDDAKKLSWLLGLEKETLADMAHQQSKNYGDAYWCCARLQLV